METVNDIDILKFKPAPPVKQLKASDMKGWLTQYRVSTRSSTVTGAFVAALLPHDKYDESAVNEAMIALNQDVNELNCVYCGGVATTWDHLINLVQQRKANGDGHRIRNLVPCCATCNSSKGGTPFDKWISGYVHARKGAIPGTRRVTGDRAALVTLLNNYRKDCPPRSPNDIELEEKLMAMRDQVLAILVEADKLVAETRSEQVKTVKASRATSSEQGSAVVE